MMNISVDTAVFCQDGYCGHTRYLIFNPFTWQFTHLVISSDGLPPPYTRLMRLASRQLVTEAHPQALWLQCTIDTFAQCEPFIQVHYVKVDIAPYELLGMPIWISPSSGEKWVVPIEEQHVPPGGVAVSRETQVEATDGHVGRFEQLVVSQEDGLITHVCFRRGHLWEQRIVTIPTTDVAHIEADAIYLKLDRASVTRLPSVSVRT